MKSKFSTRLSKLFASVLFVLLTATHTFANDGWTMLGVTAPLFDQLRIRIGSTQGEPPPGDELVAVADFNRIGAFKSPIPGDLFEDWTYNRGGMFYDEANDKLYVNAGIYGAYIHNISVPTPSMAGTYENLPAASYVQTSRLIFEGRIAELYPAGCGQGVGTGVMLVGSNLLFSGTCYYGRTAFSHFTRSSNLATTTLNSGGPSAISTPKDSTVAAGGMALIPVEYQDDFGGNDVLSGLGPISVIGRTSVGPALYAWKSADLVAGTPIVRSGTAQGGTATTITLDAGSSATNNFYLNDIIVATGGSIVTQHRSVTGYNGTTKVATIDPGWENSIAPNSSTTFELRHSVPSTPLVFYTDELGAYGAFPCIADSGYCSGDSIAGMAWLEGTRTVAVFGTHSPGIYTPCYGAGGPYVGNIPASTNVYERYLPTINTTTGAPLGTTIQDGDLDNEFVEGFGWIHTGVARCYDPIAYAKGEHNYPYKPWVYLYDALDLLKVYNGDINPETSLPYQPGEIMPYEHGELPDLEAAYPCVIASQCLFGVAIDKTGHRIFVAAGVNWTAHVFEWQ